MTTGAGPHAHAVLSGAFVRDQAFAQHARERIGLQLLEQLAVLHAEIGEHVIVDRHRATQPFHKRDAQSRAVRVPGAADAIDRGVKPQGEENAWIAGVAPGGAFDRLDLLLEGRQVELLDQRPNEPHRVIGVEPLI